MHTLKTALCLVIAASAIAAPVLAQGATLNPNGTFVDKFGSSFTFSVCGTGADLCGTLDVLKGQSATPANLAYVGKQVMQIQATGPNKWKGNLTAGGMSAQVTVTQTGANSIDVQGCRAAIFCQTLTYNRQ